MSVLVPAPPQLSILAPLMEAIIINRATATSFSRTRLSMLLHMASAMSTVSDRQRQAVIGGVQ